ncbi:carbohydrate sulfotransferase 4-like isoform X2 [Watersipora subatra]
MERLGCYSLSSWQVQWMAKQNVSSNQVSAEACVGYCTDRLHMYSYYQPHQSLCRCDDKFQTKGLADNSSCPQNLSEIETAHVYLPRNASNIKYKTMSKSWRRSECSCHDLNCTELHCAINLLDKVCWVGPLADQLNLSQQPQCEGYKLVAALTPYNLTKTYCVRDLFGFLPTVSCDPWRYKNWLETRLYHIISKPDLVRVPLQQTTQSKPIKILLVAYYRSGSTFLSELFKGYPDSYYMYEPLYGVTSHIRYMAHEGIGNAAYKNGSVDLLARTYRCHFDGIPLSSLDYSITKSSAFFKECRSRAKNIQLSCMQALQAACLSSPMIAIKTIRFKMSWVWELLQEPQHKELKVLLLLRDPRGVCNSRMHTPLKSPTNIASLKHHAQTYCEAMIEDMEAARQLLAAGYKNNIFIVRYEDVAVNEETAVENIYKLMSLGTVPEAVKWHFRNLSQIAQKAHPFYSTSRLNSEFTAHQWKTILSYEMVQEVDKICSAAYKISGYLPVVNQQQLLNRSNFHRTNLPG